MKRFHFHKVFRMGKRAGKHSTHPTFTVEAESMADAEVQAKGRKLPNLQYVCVEAQEAAEAPEEKAPVRAGRNPHRWAKGERCWIKLTPWDESYEPGMITGFGVSPSAGEYAQVYAETGGFRAVLIPDLRLNPPRKRRKRKKVELTRDQEAITRPTIKIRRKKDS